MARSQDLHHRHHRTNRHRTNYRTRKYRESIRANGKPIPEIVATLEYEAGNGKKEIKAKNQNIMRHSFISYHMKLSNNAGLTSAIAGNSERQVEGTYLEMVEDQRDAKLWFCINPIKANVSIA